MVELEVRLPMGFAGMLQDELDRSNIDYAGRILWTETSPAVLDLLLEDFRPSPGSWTFWLGCER